MNLHLRFSSESEAKSVLYNNELPNFLNIDTIGIIYEPTGEMKQTDDGLFPVMVPLYGWHVNVLAMPNEDVEILKKYIIEVDTPNRIWAECWNGK